MNELQLSAESAFQWFPQEVETNYVLVRVSSEHANEWADVFKNAVRRCYISDQVLSQRALALEAEVTGTYEDRQAIVIEAKLPDPGATMAGDFGEILIYVYQAANALPNVAIGAKKWRLKQDRTKPAPCSDVVHFILPDWPFASGEDEVLCAEVKMKSTNSVSTPIQDAIADCEKDRTSRLSRTLQWLKERALGGDSAGVQIAQLDRFIQSTDHPEARKRFRAVAVICEDFVEMELNNVPAVAPDKYELIIVSVPDLHSAYNAVFQAAKASTL